MTTKTTTYGIPGRAGFRCEISGGTGSACVVVRRFILSLLLSALLTPLSTLFSACGHDELVPPDVYVEETTPYVELRIAVPLANPASTRANPMGGEEGNGREQGLENEDRIHDINVYFYQDVGGKGMNTEDAEILGHYFYNLDDKNAVENSELLPDTELVEGKEYPNNNSYYGNKYVSLKFKCSADLYSKAQDICFVAVANIGKIQYTEGMKLSDLRELPLEHYGNSWNKVDDAGSMNAKNMDYFLMSTAYNNEYTYGGQSTGTNRINDGVGTTTMQRLYARLDLWYNKTTNVKKTTGSGDEEKITELEYPVNGVDGNKVYLTNVLPVNIKQTPSYLFKKVTASGTADSDWSWSSLSKVKSFTWGGREDPTGTSPAGVGNDYPLNYVMEPQTLQKNKSGTEGNLEKWYKSTRASVVKEKIKDETIGAFSQYYHMYRPAAGSDPKDYNCDHISIISYANENTHPTDCFHSNYLTGMAFRAVYVPDKIYSGSNTVKQKDEEGNDIDVVVPKQWTIEDGEPTKIYRYSRTTKVQEEKNSLYFTDRNEAEKYAKARPGDMAIITPADEGFTATKHDGKWGFICYYNLWLRHYNNEDLNSENGDPTTNYPMEYATVRNNIYRVAVSFRGPGDPTPTMREPDTMKARIFVRKWNYREEKDPLIYD